MSDTESTSYRVRIYKCIYAGVGVVPELKAIGESFGVTLKDDATATIEHLKDAVWKKSEALITQRSAAVASMELKVYKPGTRTDTVTSDSDGSNPKSEIPEELLSKIDLTATGPFIVVAPARQDDPQEQTAPLDRFKSLLKGNGITPSQPVIMQLVKHFAAALVIASDAETARDLYYAASRMPLSATELVLRNQGISVAQPFQASNPTKAILLHAFRNGYPMILKVSSAASIQHEADVIRELNINGHLAQNNLCAVEKIQFESAHNETTAMDASVSTPFTRVRFGLLMKHYQTTLAQYKIPLTADLLLRYGHQLKRAIAYMHQMGYCHLDIKPSNIFLMEADCFLGDYGTATKIGDDIMECTRNYYPSEFPTKAEKKTDFLLLAKTLMEMFEAIPSPVTPMSTTEIMAAIENIEGEPVKDFLKSCFDVVQAGAA